MYQIKIKIKNNNNNEKIHDWHSSQHMTWVIN